MQFKLLHPADQLVMFISRVYQYGMTTTSGGNLSIMDETGDIWITPSSIDKGSLTRKDIVQVKPDGTVIGLHKPSIELPFHRLIYSTRRDIKAVLHAHPPALVAFSIARIIPNSSLLTNVDRICGGIAKADYAIPGSMELGKKITKKFAEGYNTILMDNHGAVIGAENIFKAFEAFETFDFCARLEINARKIGTPRALSPQNLKTYKHKLELKIEEYNPGYCGTEERGARYEMCALIKRAYDQKLFASTQGTFSQRLAGNAFIITPYGEDRKYLEPSDLVRIENSKCEEGKTPSRSVFFHEQIYKLHPEVNSIIIAHPPSIMAFAVTDVDFDSRLIPESYINLRDVDKLPFGSSFMQPELTAQTLSLKKPVVIIENDCVIVTGSNLLNAFDRLEVIEYSAKSVIATMDLGSIVKITQQEVDDMDKDFNLPT